MSDQSRGSADSAGVVNGLKIYILVSDDGYYYVGKTYDIKKRLIEHEEYKGSAWTRLHKPTKCVAIVNNISHYDELKYTLIYMEKYGVDRVRGSVYCRLELTDEEKREIEKHIRSARDVCYNCGSWDHFVSNCPMNEPDIQPKETIDEESIGITLSMLNTMRPVRGKIRLSVINHIDITITTFSRPNELSTPQDIIRYNEICDVYDVIDDLWLDLGNKGYVKISCGDTIIVEQIEGESLSPYL